MQTEQDTLENALRAAATVPAERPAFYRLLLESSIYVIGSPDQLPEGSTTLPAGASVQIQNWQKPDGAPVIPFFSSLAALQSAITSEQGYLLLPARTFLEMTLGATLVLNPKSDYGKEFFPDQVEALLADGVNKRPSQRVVAKETQVLLGQPREYPAAMVASLTALLVKHHNVKAAYLALMHDASTDDKPHLVIGIEADGDFAKVIREAGTVAGDTAPDGEPVDLVRVVRDESGLSRYFIEQTKPFYERRWGAKLRSMFGAGHG